MPFLKSAIRNPQSAIDAVRNPQSAMGARSGFTLVEMLVALALTVFMMAILSEAFVTGLKAMRDMKALGDMTQRLRDVAAILRRDLAANHFEGNRKLSTLTASGLPVPKNIRGYPTDAGLHADYRMVSPRQGFFEIQEEPFTGAAPLYATRIYEGMDTDGRYSERDIGDELAFTIRLSGKDRNNVFDGSVQLGSFLDQNAFPAAGINGGVLNFDSDQNNGRFMSNWAEVAYFMRHNNSRPSALSLGQAETNQTILINTFTLYRRQLLLVPDAVPSDRGTGTAVDVNFAGTPIDMSAYAVPQRLKWFYTFFDLSAGLNEAVAPGQFFVNSPTDVQLPDRRFTRRWTYGGAAAAAYRGNRELVDPNNLGRLMPIDPTNPRTGGDILLNNVVSFDVKVWDPVALAQLDNVFTRFTNPPNYRGAFVDVRHKIPTAFGGTANPANPQDGPYNAPVIVDGIPFGWNPYSCFAEDGLISTLPSDYNKRYFDTGSDRVTYAPSWPRQNYGAPGNTIPPLAIPAIQITIRVYEPRTQQTRQITIVQDM